MKKGYGRAMRLVPIVALVAVAASGVLVIGLSFLEEKILFHPSRRFEITPDALNLPWDDVRIRVPDGATITGWLLPAGSGPPLATILFLHGNAGNISHRLWTAESLRREGLSVLLIDYRGYGESEGTPSEAGLYLDARAAWDDLTGRPGVDPARVVLYGESIGSAPALHLARELRRAGRPGPEAVVLEGAFTSAVEMGRRLLPFLPIGWVLRARMDNLAAIREVDVPTLVVHGSADEIIPVEMGRRLYEASPASIKDYMEVPGARHNTVWMTAGPGVSARLAAFLRRAAAAPEPAG